MRRPALVGLLSLLAMTLALSGCVKNTIPNRPPAPAGPDIGRVGHAATFHATATDPELQRVALRIDWDDGDTSDWSDMVASGDTAEIEHTWSRAGTFRVSAQARDDQNATSLWSDWHSITIADTVNLAPDQPSVPAGPDTARVDSAYEFTTMGTDPNHDRIYLQFDWGYGDTSAWSALLPESSLVRMTHVWADTGYYLVRARARDEKGLVSDWSEPRFLTVLESLP